MASITTLPYEIVLEITRSAALRDSVALLITCKVLHEICKARSFWIDQVLRLKERFNLLLPDHIGSLAIEDLKRTAWSPYRFEIAIRQQKIQLSHCGRFNTPMGSNYWEAKIVPGGQWLFTLSSEPEDITAGWCSLLRVWRITEAVPAVPTCIASFRLRENYSPMELCLQPGDSSLDLFVFVNSRILFSHSQQGCYLQVLHVNMADGNPQFSPVVGLRNRRVCSGMGIQGQNVVVTFPEGRDWSEALIWDWRNDERNVVQSPKPAGKYWFMAASKTIATLWDLETRSIEVHLPSPSGGYAKVGSHHPISAASTEEVPGGADDHAIDIIPTFVDSWKTGTDLHRIALAHLEQETLRIDMEDLGAGRIGFTSYLKDNTHMEDLTSPHGDESEVPANFFKTISDHLVDLSSSGRLTLYLSPEGGGEETECISYLVDRARVDDIHLDHHSSFICPFSGIVGSVSTGGNLFIWRLGQDACI